MENIFDTGLSRLDVRLSKPNDLKQIAQSLFQPNQLHSVIESLVVLWKKRWNYCLIKEKQKVKVPRETVPISCV